MAWSQVASVCPATSAWHCWATAAPSDAPRDWQQANAAAHPPVAVLVEVDVLVAVEVSVLVAAVQTGSAQPELVIQAATVAVQERHAVTVSECCAMQLASQASLVASHGHFISQFMKSAHDPE